MLRNVCLQRKYSLFVKVILLGISLMLVFPGYSFADDSEEIFLSLEPQEAQSMELAKEGVVRILAGYVDEKNKFHKVSSTNGVLVSNSQDGAYIISSYHGLKTHGKKRKDSEGFQTDSIRVAVRGDVSDELTRVAESRKKDYCILRAENVIAEKTAIGLENVQPVSAGDDAVGLVFRKKDEEQDYLDYDATDVEERQVTITKCDGEAVLGYSSETKISLGSPLLNQDGYVIGVVNGKPSRQKQDKAIFCKEVAEVLDNYQIPYRNRLTEETYRKLFEQCKDDYRKVQSRGYDSDSKAKLQTAVDHAIDTMREYPDDFDQLSEAMLLLVRGERGLKKKTQKTFYIMIALGCVILYLGIRFVRLLLWRRKQVKPVSAAPAAKETSLSDDKTVYVDRTMKPAGVSMPAAKLQRMKDGSTATINKKEYVIGKNMTGNDLVLSDNPTISRRHAMICWTEGAFRICDLGSSNGTWVNGQKVDREGIRLTNKDILRLADEEFVFMTD